MKALSILKAISWVTSKLSFLEKSAKTVTCFVRAIETFEVESAIIWEDEKNNNNDVVSDTVNGVVTSEK